jgi:hypothetical protein
MTVVKIFPLNDQPSTIMTPITADWSRMLLFDKDPLQMLLKQFQGEIDIFHLRIIELLWKKLGEGSVDVTFAEIGKFRKVFSCYQTFLDVLHNKVVDQLDENPGKPVSAADEKMTWGLSWQNGELSVLLVRFDNVWDCNEGSLIEVLWNWIKNKRTDTVLKQLAQMSFDLVECMAELDVILEAARRLKVEKDQALVLEKA